MESKLPVSGEQIVDSGSRARPDVKEILLFTRRPQRSGGFRKRNPAATRFAERFAASVDRRPQSGAQPKWLRALAQKNVSVDELANILRDRVHRAPSKANQEFALLLANQIARMEGGSEALRERLTPELLARLGGKRRV